VAVAGIDLVGADDTIKAAAIVMLLVIMIPRHLSRRWPTRQVGCAIDSRPGLARQSSCRPIHAIGRGRPRSHGEGRCVGCNRPVVRPCGLVPRRVGRRDVSCDIWLSRGTLRGGRNGAVKHGIVQPGTPIIRRCGAGRRLFL
jgi:hypothetical protein